MPHSEPTSGLTAGAKPVITTVMFADIARSTELYRRLGDEPAARLVENILTATAGAVESGGGVPLRTKGDEVLCIFPEAGAAVRAAARIHAAIRLLATRDSGALEMRIGINTGPVLHSQGDILGDTVNVAARIVALAKGGQTLVSGQTLDALGDLGSGLIRPMGEVALKGTSGLVAVFEFHDSSELDDITQVGPAVAAPSGTRVVRLRFNSRALRLDHRLTRFVMGRAPDCDLALDHPLVSRRHAEIRYENHDFILLDFSTNGTLLITGGESHMLHHSQATLWGRGTIFLGRTGFDRSFEISFEVTDP